MKKTNDKKKTDDKEFIEILKQMIKSSLECKN